MTGASLGGDESAGTKAERPPGVRHSRLDGLRGNGPGAGCVHRTGNSGKVPAAEGAVPAVLRQTWRLPAAWWCRGCACRHSVPPSDPGRFALAPGSGNACLSEAFFVRGRLGNPGTGPILRNGARQASESRLALLGPHPGRAAFLLET